MDLYPTQLENFYGLEVGEKASERLDMQHALVGIDSENHLLEAGLKRGMVVLELGCGNGAMIPWIASQVGETGRVIAVDNSPKQLEIAKKRVLSQGITNVEFICCDIQDLDLPPDSFDLVYCRFLLMHLSFPQAVLKKALSLLKEGGVFAAQEPINSSLSLYPERDPLIQELQRYFQNISKTYRADYDLGKHLYPLFYEAGYSPIHLHFSQRVTTIPQMKELLLRFLDDLAPNALKTGVISEEALTKQVASIQNYPEKAGSYFIAPQQAHISAYKNRGPLPR